MTKYDELLQEIFPTSQGAVYLSSWSAWQCGAGLTRTNALADMVSNIWPDNNVCSYTQQATAQSFKLNHSLYTSRKYSDRNVENKIIYMNSLECNLVNIF